MFDQDLTNLAFQFQREGLISAEISGRPPRLLARGKCPRCGQTFDINMPMSIVAVGAFRTRTRQEKEIIGIGSQYLQIYYTIRDLQRKARGGRDNH